MSFFARTRLYLLLIPLALSGLGFSLNEVVIVANGGKFPVMVNASEDKYIEPNGFFKDDDTHCRMTAGTHMNWLADYIRPGPDAPIMSVGDLFIEFGSFLSDYSLVAWATAMIIDSGEKGRARAAAQPSRGLSNRGPAVRFAVVPRSPALP